MGFSRRLLRAGAVNGQRLHRIGHGVAVRGIAVPGLQRQHLAHLVANEVARRLQARIEALHVADLQELAGSLHRGGKPFDLLDRNADRLFAEHVLAGRQRTLRRLDMKCVRGRDDHRVQLGIGKHRVIVEPGLRRPVEARHALDEIASHVADRVKLRIACLLAGFEMRELSDGAASEHAHPQSPLLFGNRHALPTYLFIALTK